eukprot:GHVS01029302.1.p4 GENE.GHVS01029302.1~~GHVS01029302.1.p4  ORF type:complete len:125 (-),score=22.04 GHVS01029302.1:2125-2499(-)
MLVDSEGAKVVDGVNLQMVDGVNLQRQMLVECDGAKVVEMNLQMVDGVNLQRQMLVECDGAKVVEMNLQSQIVVDREGGGNVLQRPNLEAEYKHLDQHLRCCSLVQGAIVQGSDHYPLRNFPLV